MKARTIAYSMFLLSPFLYSCQNETKPAPAIDQSATEIKTTDTAAIQQTKDISVVEGSKKEIATTTGKKEEKKKASVADSPTPPVKKTGDSNKENPSESEINEGKDLLIRSDCLTCHKVKEKLIGPSYADIANKYPYSDGVVQTLANKIINGGAGAWGQIPMTPHPNLAPGDAKKMVAYILSLK